MDETVPSVSSGPNSGPTARRPAPQQQQQQQPHSPTHLTNNNVHSSNHGNNDVDDDDGRDDPRRRTQRSIQSLLTILSSPTTILFRIIAFLAILVRMALGPFHKLSHFVFPANELDGLHLESGRRAARAFCYYFSSQYLVEINASGAAGASAAVASRSRSTSTTTTTTTTTTSSHEENNENDELLSLCPFVKNGYQETLTQILDQAKQHERDISNDTPPLLFLYLHAPLHPSSQTFCTNTLADGTTLELLSSLSEHGQLSCWAGSLHSAEGNHVASMMQVVRYPFVALVKPSSSSRSSSSSNSSTATATATATTSLEVYFRMEGPSLTRTTSSTFQTYLQTALGAYQTQVSAQMQSRLQRQEEVRLRQEQDAEYEAALEADRKRDVERAEEAARVAEEAERIAMEVQAVQNEKETILREAQSLLEERGEPQVGERCCKIRLVLPTGQKLLRNFHPNDTVQVVRAFLIVYFEQQEVDISNFGLCMNYPKKDLVEEHVTLESEGLCPQAVIMVQDLDA